MHFWLALFIVCCLIVWSLWVRIKHFRALHQNIDDIETKPSPLSLAVQELIASAGGVYLSLVTLVSFLKLDIPDKTDLFAVAMDPLALASLGIAIVQPLFTYLFHKDRR